MKKLSIRTSPLYFSCHFGPAECGREISSMILRSTRFLFLRLRGVVEMTPIRRLLSIVTKKSLLFFSFFQKKRSSQLSFDLVVVLFEYAPYFSCILVCSFI